MTRSGTAAAAVIRLAAATVSAAVLCACSQPSANSPTVRGLGYVRLNSVLKVHPLYHQLSQIENAIDALNLSSLGTNAIPRSASQIAQATRHLNAELAAAQQRANATLARQHADYAQREQAAIDAALIAAGQGTSGAQALNGMRSVAAGQAQAAGAQANADFQRYQQQVIAQDSAAVAAVSKQFSDRAQQAYRQKQTQLQEGESQLSLELSQQDAGKRLEIQTKLGNLAMSDAARKQLEAQLSALNRRESDALARQRSADQQELARYETQLRAQTNAQIAAAAQKIHAATRAKLQLRRNEVSQQISSQIGLSPAAVPPNLPAATRSRIAAINREFQSKFTADARKTIAQYEATKAVLDQKYSELQGADGADFGAANAQIAALQKQRDDLYNHMLSQIKSDAAKIAAKRGLRTVFINIVAAPGGIDLTNDVEKDIESLHQ